VCRFFFLLFNFSAIIIFNTHAASQNRQPIEAVKRPQEPSLGSRVDELERKNEHEKAISLLESQFKKSTLPSHLIYWRLAALAHKSKQSRKWRNYLNKMGPSSLATNTQLIGQIFYESRLADQKWLIQRLQTWRFFEPLAQSSCPFFELDQRKNRAALLNHMLGKGAPEEKIFSEIYIIFPEVIQEIKYNKRPKFIAWQKKLNAADFITRMNNLMLFGKNLEARQSYQDALRIFPNMNASDTCEIKYAYAKLQRKSRLYHDARNILKSLNTCGAEITQKARYLDLMLASTMGDLRSAKLFDNFVTDYPTHGFSDDVLLFKANMFLDKGDHAQALDILSKLIELFPHGDMIERALFLKALVLAREAQPEKALLALETLKTKSNPEQLAYAQADYWTARLLLFPDLTKLGKAQNKNIKKATTILNKLVISPNPNAYSWLAFELLGLMGHKTSLPKKSQDSYKKEKLLVQNKQLKFINLLIEHDFKHEALALLDQEPAHEDLHDLGGMAQAYINLGRPELGHQKLVKCDENRAAKLQKAWPNLYAQISWPQPFVAEINQAAQHIDIPVCVINAVVRQESGFLTQARSWAQAHGLMQLVTATAKEQAARLGLKEPTAEDLYQPQLNLLLGSTALFGYWQRFRHLAVALSAYNAGPTAAQKWLKQSSGPLDTYIEEINFKETRAYVINVLGGAFAYAIMNNPSQIPPLAMKLEVSKSF